MKRDMDLAREILLKIEESSETMGCIDIHIDGKSNILISYHIKILHQAGLIEALNLSDGAGIEWKAKSLTWEGHEFIDAARNETIWKKAKETVISKAGSLSFDIMKEVLLNLIRSSLTNS